MAYGWAIRKSESVNTRNEDYIKFENWLNHLLETASRSQI